MESPMSESHSEGPQDARPDPVPLIDLVAQHQGIESEVIAAVSRVFAEQRFILGDEVAELECDLAEYCDSREAIGCAAPSSGISATSISPPGIPTGMSRPGSPWLLPRSDRGNSG